MNLLVLLRQFMTAIYVHIPFCVSRCIYCGFYSTTLLDMQDSYIDAVCKEIELRTPCSDTISTIYLGGGTPSCLSEANLNRLFLYIYKMYNISPDAEITIECNPDDVCRPDFHLPTAVNRVSMGAQTFSDSRLRFINRRHKANDVDHAVDKLRRLQIRNISIDLMFGFPEETLDDWRHDIDHALDLQVEHLSAYSLMYEEGTRLQKLLEQGIIKEISDELSLEMYDLLTDTLTGKGFEHYEISNFARPGFRSRHNSCYWHDIPYIGLGAAAHSYDRKSRRWNCADIDAYINNIKKGIQPFEMEIIDPITHYNDTVTTALRTCEGIDMDRLPSDKREYLLQCAEKHLASGRLHISGHRIHLTRQGIYLSDDIMSDLILV